MSEKNQRTDPELDRLVEATGGIQPGRRLLHAITGTVAAAFLTVTEPGVALRILAVLLGVVLLGDVARLRIPSLNRLAFRILRPFASPREKAGIASSTWYLVGVLGAVVAYPVEAAIPAILVLAFADPSASVVGRLRGRTPLGKGSVEGTSVFLLVALLVLTPQVGWPAALAGALAGALVEILPFRLDDNLTIPLAVGAALTLVGIPA